jgi:hypothetical protein
LGCLITPLWMSHEESYATAFPFDKMVSGLLGLEMIGNAAKIGIEKFPSHLTSQNTFISDMLTANLLYP